MARHMFFGGNTPDGFCNMFSDIIFLDEAQKIIYLKGSPGSGKSTFMKKVGRIFENKGTPIDYIHCSNSAEDLDGICIRDIGACIVDGTAPHICDPVVPVAIDEIFDAAVYIDRKYVTGKSKELLELQSQKKQYYDKAYRYLNAAYQIYYNNYYIYSKSLNQNTLGEAIEKELSLLDGLENFQESLKVQKSLKTPKKGRNRRFFAEAITPQGYINYAGTLTEGKTVVALCGQNGTGTELMLEALRDKANKAGLNTESTYYPLKPDKLECLSIPCVGLLFVTEDEYYPSNVIPERKIDFGEFINQGYINSYKQEIEYNTDVLIGLVKKSIGTMADQKETHDRIEKVYVDSMDFNSLNQAQCIIINRLLELKPVIPQGYPMRAVL